jgi:hypothetical protein
MVYGSGEVMTQRDKGKQWKKMKKEISVQVSDTTMIP